jgi:hypothetical protein
LKWGLGPVAVAVLAGALAEWRAGAARGEPWRATASLSEAARKDVESAPALAMANAIWAFGNVASVMKMFRTELDRLPESEGPRRSRVFLRSGIIDTNPDGQAAIFFQACAADDRVCDHDKMKEAAERETRARFVGPGNVVPLSLLGGHPPIPGRR